MARRKKESADGNSGVERVGEIDDAATTGIAGSEPENNGDAIAAGGTQGAIQLVAEPDTGPAAPQKRGRGRPRSADSGASAGTDAAEPAVARRRKKKTELDLTTTLAPTLQFAHTAVAQLSGQPFWAIDKKEAEELARAANNIFAEYDMEVSPRVAAWINLVTVATAIYGPRAFAYNAYKKALSVPAQNGETVQ